MGGYTRDEVHKSYEDDIDEYEEEEGEEYSELEETEEKEDDWKPTKEESEFFELREKLKDAFRKKMKKENGAITDSQEKKKKLPYDSYGTFFGPSQPVISQRVIQESKPLLEKQQLTARSLPIKTLAASTPNVGTGPGLRGPQLKVNEKSLKVQKLKDNRDYSFLLSEDADLPAPTNEPPQNVSAEKNAQLPSKNKQSMSTKTVSSGREGSKSLAPNFHVQKKAGPCKVVSTIRPSLITPSSRKQLSCNTGNGSGRPLPSKMAAPMKVPSSNKMQAPSVDRKTSSFEKPVVTLQRPPAPSSKLHLGGQKQLLEQRRKIQGTGKAENVSKQVSSAKPQLKPTKQMGTHASKQVNNPKKRPTRPYSDGAKDRQAISTMIRKILRYNPENYVGDDEDVSDMEANFDDIQKEERRSSKAAKEEDERELRLIEEEERRERLRKQAKRRKLIQP